MKSHECLLSYEVLTSTAEWDMTKALTAENGHDKTEANSIFKKLKVGEKRPDMISYKSLQY